MYSLKSFAVNTLLIGLSRVSGVISFLILTPLMTSKLSQGEYGVVDLVITYGAIVAPIAMLSINDGVFRYLIDARDDKHRTSQILVTSYAFTSIITMMVAVVYLGVCYAVGFNLTYEILFYTVMAIYNALTLGADRGAGHMKVYVIASLASSLGGIVSVLLALLVFQGGVSSVVVALGCALLASNLIGFFAARFHDNIRRSSFDTATLKELLRYSIPLAPNAVSWWVFRAFDRTAILVVLGLASTGIYAVSSRFASIMAVFQGALLMAWQETAVGCMAKPAAERNAALDRFFKANFIGMSSVGIAILAVTPIAFPILVGDGFREAYIYIPILVIGGVFNAIVSFYSGIYGALKMTRAVLNTSLLAGVVNIVITLALIYSIEIWAAALSTAVAYAVMAIYRHIDMRKYVTVSLNLSDFTVVMFIYVILIAIYYADYVIADGNWLVWAGMFFAFSALILLNKSIIIKLWHEIKTKYVLFDEKK